MVKKVFPLLLSYVFVTTQCWALDGGPVYGNGNGKISPIGVYSGVLTGLTESDVTTTTPTIPGDDLPPPSTGLTTNSNALGLFDLTVPATGTASGAFLLFADGSVFGGTIDASVDPDSDVLKGIVQGTFSFTLNENSDVGVTSTTVTAEAVGMISANIKAPKSNSGSTARLTGTSSLDVNFGAVNTTTLQPIVDRVITFSVNGFRQTTTATTTVSAIGTTSSTTGGSTGAGGSGG